MPPSSWGRGWSAGSEARDGWDGGGGDWDWHSPHKTREWQSPSGKQRPWEEKYTYLNGPAKQQHTVPVEDWISMARGVVNRVQEDVDVPLKLPVVKTLQWPADVIDAVFFIFCGIGRKVLGGTERSIPCTMHHA